ncbi:MAG: hypothetical protein NC097_00735 [Clostridium sp.]|nr:hypothetical protein [Prevotella sp.]MCM1428306.1 hypothetical protein [Clostridium sp.]MCM1474778.1 hypothetical protein [Muribaculaceae bacterium]
MDTKERHIKENESEAKRNLEERKETIIPDATREELRAEGRSAQREGKSRSSRLWIWLGVIVLVFILIYWLFTLGVIEDVIGITNG